MIRAFVVSAFVLAALTRVTAAIDYPLGGNLLRLEDPGDPHRRIFFFRSLKQSSVTAANIADPTVSGATVQVVGSGAGDGDSSTIQLPAANWRRLRNGGYYYRDHAATNGISQVRIRPRAVGGSVYIGGHTATWNYIVAQPQTDVRVRLQIGGSVFCARFGDLQPNRAGMVLGKNNAAPADCN